MQVFSQILSKLKLQLKLFKGENNNILAPSKFFHKICQNETEKSWAFSCFNSKNYYFFLFIFAGKTSQMLTCLILFLQEKPHKCSMCSKSFPTPGDLKSHTYVHTGTWPFKCHICHRGFSKQTNLKNHLLLHSGNFLKTAVT